MLAAGVDVGVDGPASTRDDLDAGRAHRHELDVVALRQPRRDLGRAGAADGDPERAAAVEHAARPRRGDRGAGAVTTSQRRAARRRRRARPAAAPPQRDVHGEVVAPAPSSVRSPNSRVPSSGSMIQTRSAVRRRGSSAASSDRTASLGRALGQGGGEPRCAAASPARRRSEAPASSGGAVPTIGVGPPPKAAGGRRPRRSPGRRRGARRRARRGRSERG